MGRTFRAALLNELTKFTRQKFTWVGLAVVVVLAFFWVRFMMMVPGSGEELNGYLVVIQGTMGMVTLVIPLFAVIFASVVVASETAGGTYRNILGRPIRRSTFLTVKILFACAYALLLLVCYIVAAVVFSLGRYSFGPIVDAGEVVYSRWQMIGISLLALVLTLAPLFAIVTYGIFVSTIAKSLISAVGIGVGLLFALEPLKYVIRIEFDAGERYVEWNLADYILTSYLDTAPKIAGLAARGLDFEWFGGPESVGAGLLLSCGCAVVFLAISYTIFLRRDLNFS